MWKIEGDEMSNKDSVYWQIYADIWNFHKAYFNVQDDDGYWDEVIQEASEAIKSMKASRSLNLQSNLR